jgi:hypothetical protein
MERGAIDVAYLPEDGVVVVDPADGPEREDREPHLRLLSTTLGRVDVDTSRDIA